MPPKGRGRGRGVPPGRQDQPAPGQQQHEGRQDQPERQQQAASEPKVKKEKPRQVDPEELGLQFEHKCIIEPDLPRNPGPGRMGMKIALRSNHYKINLPSGDVYHYDIEISSKRRSQTTGATENTRYRCLNTKRNREVVNYMLKTVALFRNILAVYDGRKNMYTRKPLALKNKVTFTVEMPDEYQIRNEQARVESEPPRVDSFEVDIQPVIKKSQGCGINLDMLHALYEGRISSVPQEVYMALETVLRNSACLKFVPVGRNFFYPPRPEELHPLGGGREIWFGYHQSLRIGEWGPTVNVDTSATVFYQKGPVLNYIADILQCRKEQLSGMVLRDNDAKRISKELKTMQIEVTHLPYRRKYRILGVTKERADRLEFESTINGRQQRITVANYFQRQYGALKYPNLPCIQAAPKEKKIYLPIEVCDMIEGQHCKKKLEERQNAEMIKFTARAPEKRFGEIADLRRRANYDQDPYLREFGISVSKDPILLDGRVIEAPNVRYKDNKKIMPRDGSWDMRDNMYFKGGEIKSWALLSFGDPRFIGPQDLDNFARNLCQIGSKQGISIKRPDLIEMVDRRTTALNALQGVKRKLQNPDLVLCVVSAKSKEIYGQVKQAAETELALSTQCVKDSNVKACKPALISNLCQKINAKVGGINNSLTPGETPEILRRPVIIIGADVNHPAPSVEVKPSMAAVVGSLDAHPSRYAVSIRAQKNIDEKKKAIEYILDLKDMVMELLKAFYRSTGGKKPEKIIFYRDGVSEGQFGIVQEKEVTAIRAACRQLSPDYEPGLTFVVVQKRHHTRFMTQDPRKGVGKMKNIPPGTTVDTALTHPLNFDFFLCSHFGLQGTSRPGHYTVIQDDNKFTQDDLQKLTYYLCHTYVRCTKSVSIPSPVNYAHLAAYRARVHLATKYDDSSESDNTSLSDIQRELPDIVSEAIKVQDIHKVSMYFV